MLNYSKTSMEELDVTSAWILNRFITISTVTMNMKWTCPEKAINLPPSQTITVLFFLALYWKNKAEKLWFSETITSLKQLRSPCELLSFVEWRLAWATLRNSHRQWRGGGPRVPLWCGKEGFLRLTEHHTHVHTHTPTHTHRVVLIWN